MIILMWTAVIAGIFLADCGIKKYVEKSLKHGEKRECLKGHVYLRKIHNTGFAGSLGRKHPRLVAAVSLTVTIAGVFFLIVSFGQRGNGFVRAGLSLILGGGFSNTYDRLKKGYVVDYLNFPVKSRRLSRLVFNVSDFCILIGALLTTLGVTR